MDFALFTSEGLVMFLRWVHYLSGVIWIGMLYYFNFVQGGFFAKTDATTKGNMTKGLVPEALWWFRWGAMGTILSGLCILMIRGHESGFEVFSTSWGIAILTGAAMGTFMWANVWFIIWPAQKLVIAAANGDAAAKKVAPARGAHAAIASRTNTLFSIPMLFFMGAASHLPLSVDFDSNLTGITAVVGAIIVAIEANAIKGFTMGPMKSVKGVIHLGVALTAVLYFAIELML